MTRTALLVVLVTSLLVSPVMAAPKMTPLDPARHGFWFANTFHSDYVPQLDVRTSGLCAGMSYTVLDYYYARKPIPTQDYRPANRTPLQSYLFNRHMDSNAASLAGMAELGFNPGGVRNDEFFRWGLETKPGSRITELRSFIDRGVPVPLALQGASGRSGEHEVIAIGYDMGRYQGNLGPYQDDFKIFILDPNYPRVTKTLIPDLKLKIWRLADVHASGWQSYFVDKTYKPKDPPSIVNPAYPNDGTVRELLLTFETGGDDLRGGNDNVNVLVNLYDGTQQTYQNVNLGGRWIVNYQETVRIVLSKPAPLAQIKDLVISTTFGGGVGGDNWDMKSLKVRAIGGGLDRKDVAKAGPYRFTGQAKQIAVAVSPKPATPSGMVDRLDLDFKTGNDDLRGGNDNVNVTITFKDGTSQTFDNVNHSSRWADGTSHTVTLSLNRAVPPAMLMTITIRTTFGGGMGGDNWNMNSVQARVLGPGISKVVSSSGFKRFTGSDKVLVLPCTP